jgi:serine phosphatase RsbU (regulator of sigma subunit)
MVELDDGWLHLIIGDVAGHGPEEAAIGVSLRMSWRALALAGHEPTETLHHLNVLLQREWHRRRFATACLVSVAPDRRRARVILAGHPPPLRVDGRVDELPIEHRGLPLGISSNASWTADEVELGDDWALLVYTDGLVEGLCGEGRERWGIEGLTAAAGEGAGGDPDAFVDRLLEAAEARNGAPLDDDVALLLLRVAAER